MYLEYNFACNGLVHTNKLAFFGYKYMKNSNAVRVHTLLQFFKLNVKREYHY